MGKTGRARQADPRCRLGFRKPPQSVTVFWFSGPLGGEPLSLPGRPSRPTPAHGTGVGLGGRTAGTCRLPPACLTTDAPGAECPVVATLGPDTQRGRGREAGVGAQKVLAPCPPENTAAGGRLQGENAWNTYGASWAVAFHCLKPQKD